MSIFKSLIAFGDSHVAGCELADLSLIKNYLDGTVTLEESDSNTKQFAFPQLVADKLNIPCYNYAISGGSNERSLRKLIKAVQDHPDSLVLFGYTSTDRKEFYYPDNGLFLGRDTDNFIQVGPQWEQTTENKAFRIFQSGSNRKIHHPINKQFIDKFLRYYDNIDDIMFCVNAICKLHSKCIIHIPLYNSKFSNKENVLDFEKQNNYLQWCEFKRFKKMQLGHYGHEAHKELAELIYGSVAESG